MLVVASVAGHGGDGVGRDVRRVRDEQVDAAAQVAR
jgi:hypothetical protein